MSNLWRDTTIGREMMLQRGFDINLRAEVG